MALASALLAATEGMSFKMAREILPRLHSHVIHQSCLLSSSKQHECHFIAACLITKVITAETPLVDTNGVEIGSLRVLAASKDPESGLRRLVDLFTSVPMPPMDDIEFCLKHVFYSELPNEKPISKAEYSIDLSSRLLAIAPSSYATPPTIAELRVIMSGATLQQHWDELTADLLMTGFSLYCHRRKVKLLLSLYRHGDKTSLSISSQSKMFYIVLWDWDSAFFKEVLVGCPDAIIPTEAEMNKRVWIAKMLNATDLDNKMWELVLHCLKNPAQARREFRRGAESGLDAEKLFLIMRGAPPNASLLGVLEAVQKTNIARFHRIFRVLPTELQMQICIPYGGYNLPWLRDDALEAAAGFLMS